MVVLGAADFDGVVGLEVAEGEVVVAEKGQRAIASGDVGEAEVGDFVEGVGGGFAVPLGNEGLVGDDGEVFVEGAKDGFDCGIEESEGEDGGENADEAVVVGDVGEVASGEEFEVENCGEAGENEKEKELTEKDAGFGGFGGREN